MGKCISKSVEIAEEIIDAENQQKHDPPPEIDLTVTEQPVQNENNNDVTINIYEVDVTKVDKVPHKDKAVKYKIVKIYDGDTVHVVFLYGNEPIRFAIRILGIDTPEMKSKNPLEKQAAQRCKEVLESELSKENCTLVIRNHDKYGGRLLADFYDEDGKNIAEKMISRGFGRSYNGEKKPDWTDEELQSIINK